METRNATAITENAPFTQWPFVKYQRPTPASTAPMRPTTLLWVERARTCSVRLRSGNRGAPLPMVVLAR
jgi:hypothetical protein